MEDWYRLPGWDDDARTDFERRLARSRAYNRHQYLVIKSLALRDTGDLISAKALLRRSLEQQDVAPFDRARVTELLGDLAVVSRDLSTAELHYRQVLETWPSLNGTSGVVEISLAEVLSQRGGDEKRAEAAELLEAFIRRRTPAFNNDLFRWHVARISLAKQADDRETMRDLVGAALELATSGPQLSPHKDVGIVRADQATLDWLRTLAE